MLASNELMAPSSLGCPRPKSLAKLVGVSPVSKRGVMPEDIRVPPPAAPVRGLGVRGERNIPGEILGCNKNWNRHGNA